MGLDDRILCQLEFHDLYRLVTFPHFQQLLASSPNQDLFALLQILR